MRVMGQSLFPQLILHRAIRRKKLRGDVVLADAKIRFWERVFPVAKRAGPNPGRVIDAGIGIQNCTAVGADERVIREHRELIESHERRRHDRKRDN